MNLRFVHFVRPIPIKQFGPGILESFVIYRFALSSKPELHVLVDVAGVDRNARDRVKP